MEGINAHLSANQKGASALATVCVYTLHDDILCLTSHEAFLLCGHLQIS